MKRRRHRVDPFTETLVDQLRQILVAQQVIVVRPIRIGPQLSDVRQPVIAQLLVVRHRLAVGRLLVVQVVRRIRIGPQLSDVRQRVIAAPLHLVVLVVLVIRIAHLLVVRHLLAVGRLLVVQVVRRIRIGPLLIDVRQRVIAAPLHLVVLVVLVIRIAHLLVVLVIRIAHLLVVRHLLVVLVVLAIRIAHHLDVRHFPNALHLIARAAPKFMNQIFRPTLPAMNWIAASQVNCQR
jgi:hypothetical protein